MNRLHYRLAFATLLTLTILPAARAGDRVLVSGYPPLTQSLLDKQVWQIEWALDLTFTDQQRRESEELCIEDWKTKNRSQRELSAKTTVRNYQSMSKLRPFQLNMLRLSTQPASLAKWSKPGSSALDQWLVALYEEAWKPGGTRNPILVAGDLALTQQAVVRYSDYVEWVLDFSASGGLSTQQRRILKDFLVKDWKKMDQGAFLAKVKEWVEMAALQPQVWRNWSEAERPLLVAQLYAVKDERSRWLLETFKQEREKLDRMNETERQRHEAVMGLLGNLRGSGGSFRDNASKGRYEWVSGQ
jgi:hypothetical protein